MRKKLSQLGYPDDSDYDLLGNSSPQPHRNNNNKSKRRGLPNYNKNNSNSDENPDNNDNDNNHHPDDIDLLDDLDKDNEDPNNRDNEEERKPVKKIVYLKGAPRENDMLDENEVIDPTSISVRESFLI